MKPIIWKPYAKKFKFSKEEQAKVDALNEAFKEFPPTTWETTVYLSMKQFDSFVKTLKLLLFASLLFSCSPKVTDPFQKGQDRFENRNLMQNPKHHRIITVVAFIAFCPVFYILNFSEE